MSRGRGAFMAGIDRGAIAVYRSGNARVNMGFVQTAEVLSGWRLKTGWDWGRGRRAQNRSWEEGSEEKGKS